MSGLVALAVGIGLFVALAPLFAARNAWIAYLAIVGAFIFWYWLPATNLLTVGYVGVAFFQITQSVDAACWIVLGCEMTTLAVLFAIRPLLWRDRADLTLDIRVPALAAFALVSAVLFLGVRFASGGTGGLVDLIQGQSSAREQLDFQNLSSGAGQSLMGLWEVCTIWMAMFAFSRHLLNRTVLTSYGICALAAITLMFAGSGTRAVLMQATFVFVLTMATHIRIPRPVGQRPTSKAALMLVPLVGMAGIAASAFASRFDADAGYRAAGPLTAIADTFFANNDMTRELAFVMDTMPSRAYPVVDFLLTPFTFLMPSFLGIQKSIPLHLMVYNTTRLNIDLTSGQGNAFPGLIADFWLLFGDWCILLFPLFVCLSVLAIFSFRLITTRLIDSRAYVMTGLSYLFFDFRNITGAFALVLLFGLALLKMVEQPGNRMPAKSRGPGQC